MASTVMPQVISRLRYEDRNGTVVVTPEDEDRFMITVEAAIRACQAIHQEAVFRMQFNQMLRKLAEWLQSHRPDISRAFVTVRDAGLLFLVVRSKPSLDPQFEDELTDLDLEIAQSPSLGLIRLSVLAVPSCSDDGIASFLMHEFLEYTHAE